MLYKRLPKFKFPIKIDIGCGENQEFDKKHGYIGVDIFDCGQEVLWDVRQGIPFPDESISEINTSHFLEHLSEDEIYPFLGECMRVLTKGGKMVNRLPHVKYPTAFYTDHKSFWNEEKVMTLYNPRHPIPKFAILKNFTSEAELFFTLVKI
jgi:predicted SAM-dependent methyltransferase